MSLKAPPAEYLWAVTGGLLASSCCVLQLVFNALSVGCAGGHLADLCPITTTEIILYHCGYNNPPLQ